MKTPRIEDFDPTAARPLGSPMDDLPRIEKPPLPHASEPTATPVRPPVAALSTDVKKEVGPSNRDTTTPRNRDTTAPRYHDTTLAQVRRAVRNFGKEAATHRFTLGEKKAIADLIYAFHQRGIRTSENEITRIAVNFIIQDFERSGDGSVLERVLKLLNE